jgi:anti-sigma regulatory factor (Ser/Thr protein kinase)
MNEIYNFYFPNHFHYLNYLYTISSNVLRNLPITEKEKYKVLVALSEAFTNSFLHGNKKNPKREIKVSFKTETKRLQIEIEDQGIGFALKRKRKERREDIAISGRGIFLIRKCVDKAFFHCQEGRRTKVVLIKNF